MLNVIHHMLVKLGAEEKGASAVEYAILVGIIGVALASGAQAFGTDLKSVFTGLVGTLQLPH